MPYVAPEEALNLPSLDLAVLQREMGPPPWRRPLIGTPHARWVLISWPSGFVAPPHWHPHADEVFHVLQGEATFRFAGEAGERHAPAGTLLLARRGVEHTIAVTGAGPLVLLCSITPNENVPDETVELTQPP
jgi:quercetin dioxygenase-like cupin family protein